MRKSNKDKTKYEMHSDMLNFHISKGNLLQERINKNNKNMISAKHQLLFNALNIGKKEQNNDLN